MLSATAVSAWQPSENWVTLWSNRIKAIAVDGFVVFDSRPIAKRVEEISPGKGVEFRNLWRTRQFEYTWLRTLANRYRDFWQVTADALATRVSLA
jgi:2-haloacid dehalogenase